MAERSGNKPARSLARATGAVRQGALVAVVLAGLALAPPVARGANLTMTVHYFNGTDLAPVNFTNTQVSFNGDTKMTVFDPLEFNVSGGGLAFSLGDPPSNGDAGGPAFFAPDLWLSSVDPYTGQPLGGLYFTGVGDDNDTFVTSIIISLTDGAALPLPNAYEINATGLNAVSGSSAPSVDTASGYNYNDPRQPSLTLNAATSAAVNSGYGIYGGFAPTGYTEAGNPSIAGFYLIGEAYPAPTTGNTMFRLYGFGHGPSAPLPEGDPPSGFAAFRTPVPEPASALLAAFALGGAALAVRHRRRT